MQIEMLGISGSLRRASHNSGLLRAARDLLPGEVCLRTFDIGALPLYNADLESASPAAVREMKEAVRLADAILIATPEYNYSLPGVLKNALDWVSRPRKESPFIDKPCAVMGAGGAMGTVRAQLHFRQIAVELAMPVMPKPELMVQRPWEKFDAGGNLTDEKTRADLRTFLEAFHAWILRLRPREEVLSVH